MRTSGAVLVLALTVLSGCGDLCENTVVARSLSPDGRYSAVKFVRSCGATTGFSTHVSVLPSGEEPASTGNVFIVDDNHGRVAVDAHGRLDVHVEWAGPRALTISYPSGARVFLQNTHMSEVTITYDTTEPRTPID